MQQALCVRRKQKIEKKKTQKKVRPTQNTPRNPQQPGDRDHLETAREKNVLCVSPYSPASIDTAFVEIGLVQLSESVKTTNVTHTHTQTKKVMAPCTHPGTSREVNEARRPHTCGRPCAFEENKWKKKHEKIPPHPQHTTKSTAVRRSRLPRNGARQNTSHALAHTRPLP